MQTTECDDSMHTCRFWRKADLGRVITSAECAVTGLIRRGHRKISEELDVSAQDEWRLPTSPCATTGRAARQRQRPASASKTHRYRPATLLSFLAHAGMAASGDRVSLRRKIQNRRRS